METLKEVFFFIGSLLGILAFARASFESLKVRNDRSWKHFISFVSEADLRDLEYRIDTGAPIPSELLMRLGRLADLIRADDENLRFGPILGGRIDNHKTEFARLYHRLRDYIQVPWWQPSGFNESSDDGETVWKLEKDEFNAPYGGEMINYPDHLRGAAAVAAAMRVEYRSLSLLADLDMLRLPFAKWIVMRNAPIPTTRD